MHKGMKVKLLCIVYRRKMNMDCEFNLQLVVVIWYNV